MRRPIATIALAAAGLFLAACSEAPIDAADPANTRAVEMGAVIYADNCASCHGDNLEGQPDWRVKTDDGTLPAPPHDDSGHTWHHDDSLLFSYTKLGGAGVLPKGVKSAMPGFGETLSDEQIWATLSFIKSRWPLEVQRRQAGANK